MAEHPVGQFPAFRFFAHADAQTRMAAAYEDRARWNRMALTNVAKAGIFAADRSITEYAEKIWRLKRLDGREGRT